jgi:hypothetical protein
MRFLITAKFIVIAALWSVLCLVLVLGVGLVEGVAEIGGGVAGAPIGQGGALSGLADLFGDILQWGVIGLWLVGLGVLWFVKKLLTSRETRRATAGAAIKTAATVGPYVINKHPVGRAVNMASSPGVRMLAGMIARRLGKR